MPAIIKADSNFWPQVQAQSGGSTPGLLRLALPTGGNMHLVAMKDTIRMVPFVRTKTELFNATATRTSAKEKFSVVINGPTYGLTAAGKSDALFGSDPVNPTHTIQEGFIVRDKKVIAGKASDMYYIANDTAKYPRYKFGRGRAPINVDAALGNMGPLIINSLPFGTSNKYTPPQPAARKTGQPNSKYQPYLTQRSNNRFAANTKLANGTGKIIIAHNQTKGILLIFCQQHGDIGISISGLRDLFLSVGEFSSAVYLDGSDSVMLMMNQAYIVRPASNKNETMVTGVGFKY